MVTISKEAQLAFLQGQIAEENRILKMLCDQRRKLDQRINKATELHHHYCKAAQVLKQQIDMEQVCY